MLKESIFLALIAVSSSFSMELDELVQKTFQNSYDLQKLEKNLLITEQDIALSEKWQNPTLSIGANDIQFDDPFARDIEPMQANYIGISQIIPFNNKLEYQKDIAIQDKNIVFMNIENRKLQIASLIYEYGYSILINEKKLALLKQYQVNTQELQKIGTHLYENGQVSQLLPLKADLLLSKLLIQEQNIQYKLKNLHFNLEKVTYKKVYDIEADISLESLHVIPQKITNHPLLQAVLYTQTKYNKEALLEDAKKFSDVKVNLSYFQRDDKYKDYINLSFSIPLPLYGNEESKVAKARYKSAQSADEFEVLKTKLVNDFENLKENMKKSFQNYQNLSSSMIPQKEFIQENIQAHFGLGHMKSTDLITNLNETYELELVALDELERYFVAYAKSKYYTGVWK